MRSIPYLVDPWTIPRPSVNCRWSIPCELSRPWPDPAYWRAEYSRVCMYTCNNAPLSIIMPMHLCNEFTLILFALAISLPFSCTVGSRSSPRDVLSRSLLADVPRNFRSSSSLPNARAVDVDLYNSESLTPTILLCSEQSPPTKPFTQKQHHQPNLTKYNVPPQEKQFASSSRSSHAVDSLRYGHLSSNLDTEDRSSTCRQPGNNVAPISKSFSSFSSNTLLSPSPSMSLLVPACVASSSTRRVRK